MPSGTPAPLPASVLCQSRHIAEGAEGRGRPGPAACSGRPGLPWARLRADTCLIRALPTLPCSLWPSRESPCHSAGAGRCSTGDRGHAVPLAGEAHGRVCHSVRTTVGLLWVLNKYVVDADLETTPGAKGRNAPVPGRATIVHSALLTLGPRPLLRGVSVVFYRPVTLQLALPLHLAVHCERQKMFLR